MKVHKWNTPAKKKDMDGEKLVKEIAMIVGMSFIPLLVMMLFV